MSSSLGSVTAAIAAAASHFLESYPLVYVSYNTQLFRYIASDLFRSAEPCIKVGAAIGTATFMLTLIDGRVIHHHSALFFSRIRELMVSISMSFNAMYAYQG